MSLSAVGRLPGHERSPSGCAWWDCGESGSNSTGHLGKPSSGWRVLRGGLQGVEAAEAQLDRAAAEGIEVRIEPADHVPGGVELSVRGLEGRCVDLLELDALEPHGSGDAASWIPSPRETGSRGLPRGLR